MTRFWTILGAALGVVALAGCSLGEDLGAGGPAGAPNSGELTIVAATELSDLTGLVDQAAEDLGFDITLEFPGGTLDNSQELSRGQFDGEVDATWFATNRYVHLIGASDKLADETKIASSPVAFGVWEETAKELGWDAQQPTWADFAQAAQEGKFTFGMTDPSASNSGFSALVSVATAVADTGQAVGPADLERVSPTLAALFHAQSLVSGSSGWLAEAFASEPDRADAIVNYESTLHQLRDQGHPISVIVPSDGVITADYPLSTLANPAHPDAADKVKAFADWLIEHQEDIALTYRRPVEAVETLPAEIEAQQVIELPFPANQGVVDDLLLAYNNEYRQPGTTTFVLDTSGSMVGERMESLRAIMLSLVDGSASTLIGDVSFRDRESVTFLPFSDEPREPFTVEFDRDDPKVITEVKAYLHVQTPIGSTAMYSALLDALDATDTSQGIPSIVLLSDGEANVGPNYSQFEAAYQRLPAEKRRIPVFVILYGEANRKEMEKLAWLTGGAVFDALGGDLEAAFKEIRGYQ